MQSAVDMENMNKNPEGRFRVCLCGVGLEDGVGGGKEFERRQWRETWGHKYISSTASSVCLTASNLGASFRKLLSTYDNGKVKRKAYHCFWLRFLSTVENVDSLFANHLFSSEGAPIVNASEAETEYSGILSTATCPAAERSIDLASRPQGKGSRKVCLGAF